MFALRVISGLFPLCLKANQNKPLSWNQPELSIPAADQKDRSSGNENVIELENKELHSCGG